MNTFRINGDNSRVYFFNFENVSDNEEYVNIMAILRDSGCEIGEPDIAPDCDIISCKHQDNCFYVIRTIEGYGTFIYADNPNILANLEELFK